MAAIDINGTIRHFDDIVIIISDGTDDATIDNWIDQSFSINEGGMARHDVDYTGSTQKTRRREGKPGQTMMSVRVKRGDMLESGGLRGMMNAVAGDDGLVPEYTVTVKCYNSKAADEGEQIVLANSIFNNAFNASHGDQHDEVSIDMTSHHPYATVTAFDDAA